MFALVPASGVDSLVILLLGLALDAVVGDMRPLFRHVPHPVAAAGQLIGFLEERLNREVRGERALAIRGALVAGTRTVVFRTANQRQNQCRRRNPVKFH